MCGICGYLNFAGKPIDPEILQKMANSLVHRGPDDEGFYIANSHNPSICVGLGHRRLSIIDLSPAGHQPMSNEDSSIWIVFNGEVYNFLDLKKLCEAKGHLFRSNTDTEVIIHLFEDYGIECVQRLNGMFAFAIWDGRRQTLYLARDRMGKKPLYYAILRNSFIFGSELKSLLLHPDLSREIDIEGLVRYLLFEYVPIPYSIFKDIRKLRPGCYLKVTSGGVEEKRYWELNFVPEENPPLLPFGKGGEGGFLEEDRYCEGIAELFADSIQKRLISDVPLGVFLSGGIDSSSIVAYLSELLPPDQIKTFSIGFEDRSFDESNYARKVANHFGTDHHEEVLSPGSMLEILPEVISFLDEPLGDASIIPTYLLAKFTRQYVTVALGGDGGDELFAGYPTFQAHQIARFYDKVPKIVHEKIINPLASLIPVSTNNISFDFKIKQFLKGIPYEAPIRNQIWLGSFSPKEQTELLSKDLITTLNGCNPLSDIYQSINGITFRDLLDQILFLYCKFYLANDILVKVDRASMATSLEVRAPFLDYRLVEYVNRIPSRYKLKGLTTKYILKRCMKNRIPDKIIHRGKKGFGIPISRWFKGELRDMVLDTFNESRIKREGFFNYGYIDNLLRDHFSGKKDNRKQLWTLFIFEQWYSRWARGGRQKIGREIRTIENYRENHTLKTATL